MSRSDSSDAEYDFERFKWTILGNAATEDYQGLWEPLWELRGGYEIPGLTEEERQQYAERALRELYGDKLIYFFRAAWETGNLVEADTPANRLGPQDIDAELRADWWREPDELQRADVWWCATDKGEATYMNAPDHIRSFWKRRVEKERKLNRIRSKEKGAPG